MIHIKHSLIVLLISTLVACGGSIKRKDDAKKDKNAAVVNVQLASGYIRRGDLEVAEEKLDLALKNEKNDAMTRGFLYICKCQNSDIAVDSLADECRYQCPVSPPLQRNSRRRRCWRASWPRFQAH